MAAWIVLLCLALPAAVPAAEDGSALPAVAAAAEDGTDLEAEVRRLRQERVELRRDSAHTAAEDSLARSGTVYLVVDAVAGRVELRRSGVPLRTAPLWAGAGWPAAATATRTVEGVRPCLWAEVCAPLESGDWLAVHGREARPAPEGWGARAAALVADTFSDGLARLTGTVWIVVPPADLPWLAPRLDEGIAVAVLAD